MLELEQVSEYYYWHHITANIHVPHRFDIEVISNIEHADYPAYFHH